MPKTSVTSTADPGADYEEEWNGLKRGDHVVVENLPGAWEFHAYVTLHNGGEPFVSIVGGEGEKRRALRCVRPERVRPRTSRKKRAVVVTPDGEADAPTPGTLVISPSEIQPGDELLTHRGRLPQSPVTDVIVKRTQTQVTVGDARRWIKNDEAVAVRRA